MKKNFDFITKTLLWMSGTDENLIRICPSEINRHKIIGMTVFVVSILAALSFMFVIHYVFHFMWLSMVLGLFWGFSVMCLIRLVLSTIRGRTMMKRFVSLGAIWGLLLAIVMGAFVAIPLNLVLFETDIQTLFQQEIDEAWMVKKQSLEELKFIRMNDEKERLRVYQDEMNSFLAKKKDAHVAEERELKVLKRRMDCQYQRIEAVNDSLLQQINNEEVAFRSKQETKNHGLLPRLKALRAISQETAALVLVMLLFIMIFVTPILYTCILPNGVYERLKERLCHEECVENTEQR
jgi:hypothetical protein